MAGNIRHDNILSIYDFGEDEQHRPFMVMEFLHGQDLRKAIREGSTGDIQSRLSIALQTARALRYIHTQRIIHRDVKPENIHLTPEGIVKLMDFGIAKTEGMAMTRAGFVLGTPYYMAPEQIRGQAIDQCVDIYAFGILLYELMTGSRPIAGDVVERIFYAILNEPLNLEPLRMTDTPAAIRGPDRPLHGQEPGRTAAGLCRGVRSHREGAGRPECSHEACCPCRRRRSPRRSPGRPAWQKIAMIGVPVLLALIAAGSDPAPFEQDHAGGSGSAAAGQDPADRNRQNGSGAGGRASFTDPIISSFRRWRITSTRRRFRMKCTRSSARPQGMLHRRISTPKRIRTTRW